ncbi:cobP [Symbiodinium microadriaticum]|nr:cobP [Symbiodinium microadriaticum]
MPLDKVTLVLGGARSGKSSHALGLCEGSGLDLVYLATATAGDDEMAARIAQHQAERAGRGWTTIEEPLDVAGIILNQSADDRIILIDCLTLWLSNLIHEGRDLRAEEERLIGALGHVAGPVVLIANEVGLGIVPETELGRLFRDTAGRLNQRVAAEADKEKQMTGLRIELIDLVGDGPIARACLEAAGHSLVLAEPADVVVTLADRAEPALVQSLGRRKGAIALFARREGDLTKEDVLEAGVHAYVIAGFSAERLENIVELAMARQAQLGRLEGALARAKQDLEDRKVIERAKGLLMAYRGLSEQEAYKAMRSEAMNRNKKLVDIAESLLSLETVLKDSPARSAAIVAAE